MSYIRATTSDKMSLEKIERMLEELVTNQRAHSVAIQTNALKIHNVEDVVLPGLRTEVGNVSGKVDSVMEALEGMKSAPQLDRSVEKTEEQVKAEEQARVEEKVKVEEKESGDGEKVLGAGQGAVGGAGMHGEGNGANGERDGAMVEVLTLDQVRERLKEKRKSFRSRDARFPLRGLLEDIMEVDTTFLGPMIRGWVRELGDFEGIKQMEKFVLDLQHNIGQNILQRVRGEKPGKRAAIRVAGGVPDSLWHVESERRLAGASLFPSEQAKISLNREILSVLEEPYIGGPRERDGTAALEEVWELVRGAATRNVEQERWVWLKKTCLVEVEMATSGEAPGYNDGKREEAGASALALGAGMVSIIRGDNREWDNGAGLWADKGMEALTLIALGIYMIGKCFLNTERLN